jgi:hypothetical protein
VEGRRVKLVRAATWLFELEDTQEHVRAFLLAPFGMASFWEHGGADKEVPHAHLLGVPVDGALGPDWLDNRHANS